MRNATAPTPAGSGDRAAHRAWLAAQLAAYRVEAE